MPCAASPPSTFCQEKVVTSSLSQSAGPAQRPRSRVADRQALAVGGMKSPFGTRTPLVVPFQVKTTSVSKSTAGEGRHLAVGRGLAHVVELQLLDHVGDPAFAEAFPGHHVGPRPSIDHIAISTAPVSDAGTMPMR
jgi:hypothetical protein